MFMRAMKNLFPFVFVVLSILLSGCVKNNPLPTWLIVDRFELLDNPSVTEGELTEFITDGWIYVNGKFVGIFQLPCKVPVLYEGEALNVIIYPTVRMNGMAHNKVQHPYLDAHNSYETFVAGDSTFISPKTRYATGTQLWIEDFQSGSIKLTNGIDNNLTLGTIQDPNNSNNRYGQVNLTEANNRWSVYTTDGLSFTLGRQIILEIDYCNSTNISTTVIAGKTDATIVDHPHIRLNAQDPETMVWKKIYIDVTETVSNSGGYLFWQGIKANLTEGRTNDTVLIDNIKVVYR